MNSPISAAHRWIVIALMGVALPLCCCGGRAESFASADSGAAGWGVEEHSHSASQSERDHRHSERMCCDSTEQDGSSPHHRESTPCGCGHHNQPKAPPESPATIDFWVPVLAVLCDVQPAVVIDHGPGIVVDRAIAVPRRATSLLRQHCALMV